MSILPNEPYIAVCHRGGLDMGRGSKQWFTTSRRETRTYAALFPGHPPASREDLEGTEGTEKVHKANSGTKPGEPHPSQRSYDCAGGRRKKEANTFRSCPVQLQPGKPTSRRGKALSQKQTLYWTIGGRLEVPPQQDATAPWWLEQLENGSWCGADLLGRRPDVSLT